MSGYYNVGYHTFSPDTAVTTWTGGEDSSAARSAWSNAGADPNDPSGASATTRTVVVEQNRPQVVAGLTGPRSIASIKLRVPGVTPARVVTDRGRAHRGFSQSRAAIDPGNSGVVLTRRMDYGIADQRARVLVDGAVAGECFDPDSDPSYRWRDSTFGLPPALTAGKRVVTVRVEFLSSAADWNEFSYRVQSTVAGAAVLTDTIEVGDPGREVSDGLCKT